MSAETRMNGVNIEKKCSQCNEFKLLIDYSYKANGLYNTRNWCKECESIKNKEYQKTYIYDKDKKKYSHKQYYEEHKEEIIRKSRLNVLKNKYNLTKEEFDKLSENGCYACYSMERLCVDHDHKTNEIRGILCHKCNSALGLLEEDEDRILRLAAYIKESKGKYAV